MNDRMICINISFKISLENLKKTLKFRDLDFLWSLIPIKESKFYYIIKNNLIYKNYVFIISKITVLAMQNKLNLLNIYSGNTNTSSAVRYI